MNIKGKALLAGCIALAFSNMALAEDIKVAVVGAMSGPVAQYGDQEFTGAEQAANRLTDAMQGLDERSQDIIRARWLDEDNKSTLQELADRYGVSAERVRQLEKNAMKKLRAAIEA